MPEELELLLDELLDELPDELLEELPEELLEELLELALSLSTPPQPDKVSANINTAGKVIFTHGNSVVFIIGGLLNINHMMIDITSVQKCIVRHKRREMTIL